MFRHSAARPQCNRHHGSVKLNVCRNGIAQAELSGGSRPESLPKLFLNITSSTVTTEPKS